MPADCCHDSGTHAHMKKKTIDKENIKIQYKSKFPYECHEKLGG